MDLYSENIIDLAKNPLNRGTLEEATHKATGINTTCGDHVRLTLLLRDERVEDARWEGDGCAISIAAASVLTEEMKGKSRAELSLFNKELLMQIMEIPSLGPARVKCLTLCLETLQNAVFPSHA